MDEVSFGPSRAEARPPSRRLRALAGVVSVAAVAAAGVAYVVTEKSAQHPATSQAATVTQSAAALPDPGRFLPPAAGCSPVQAHWPDLAGIPAGMRPGALPVIVDAQFSGRCPVP
jgi:hypothetical protein